MKVMLTGSFDPVTAGHLSLIRRAAGIFDNVLCVVFDNAEKTHAFSAERRLAMLKAATSDIRNVTCDLSHGYAAVYARENGVDAILRGVRDGADLAYETQMAVYNKNLTGVETILLPADEETGDVSSTEARRRLAGGEALEGILPDAVIKLLS